MKTDFIKDNVLAIIMLLVYFVNLIFGVYGYSASQEWGVWIYQFQHASILFLIANYILWRYPFKVLTQYFGSKIQVIVYSYLISVAAACLDVLLFNNEVETVGFSGMVCAAWGLDLALRYYGRVRSLEPQKQRTYIYAILMGLFIGFVLPNVNAFNHIISFLLSWIFVSVTFWLRTRRG